MVFILLFAALVVGSDAPRLLDHPHPTPAAWFEAILTGVLLIAGIVLLVLQGDDEGDDV